MKKNKLFLAILALSLALASCNGGTKPPAVNNIDSTMPSPDPSTPVDDIVNDTVVSKDGKILVVSFNNTKHTVLVTLGSEKIEMIKDTTTSGVRAYNDHYEYSDQQELTELRKDGKVIFSGKD